MNTKGWMHIKSDGHGRTTEVTLNGEKVRGVTSVEWKIAANGRAEATIVLHATVDVTALNYRVEQSRRRLFNRRRT